MKNVKVQKFLEISNILPKISLEAKGINSRQISLNRIQGTSGFCGLTDDMSPPPLQDHIEGTETISRTLDLRGETGLHDSGRGGQEGRVANSTSSRDQLTAAAVDRLLRDLPFDQLEFHVADRFFTERAFTRRPLET